MSFKQWCKQIKRQGYSPEPDHETEWLEWFRQGKSPKEAYDLEMIMWVAT